MPNPLDEKLSRFEELERLLVDPDVLANSARLTAVAREHGSLAKLATKYRHFKSLNNQIRDAMEMAASLAPSLDRFFVDVLVNCPEEDLRRNRLALLGSIQHEFSRLADFSEIVVEK